MQEQMVISPLYGSAKYVEKMTKALTGNSRFELVNFPGLKFKVYPNKCFMGSDGKYQFVIQVCRHGEWMDFGRFTQSELVTNIILG